MRVCGLDIPDLLVCCIDILGIVFVMISFTMLVEWISPALRTCLWMSVCHILTCSGSIFMMIRIQFFLDTLKVNELSLKKG